MPSLATTSNGPLGCGTYVARLVNDGGPILTARKVVSVLWNRRKGEPSAATVTLPVSGTDLRACCDGANKIEPLRTELIIERNGIPVWQGWVMNDITFRRDTITVNAKDILGWTERRILDSDHVAVGQDLVTIGLSYIADINSAGDLPFVITANPTGILADRTVLASEYRYASDPLRDLYTAGLAATVIAGHLLLGPEMQTCGTIQLRDTDIDGDPEIKLDGLQRATRVIVKGANGIVSVFPPTPPDVCFHAADFIHDDQNILDQASADATAELIYDAFSSSFPYFVSIPEGSGLKSTAGVHINALIPGAIVQFYSQTLCLEIGMAMRLVAVDVEASSGVENVRITLERIGDNEGDS